MTSPFCWQPWPNPVSLGPRPKDLRTQAPKSRPLSEKGAELIRKRRTKNVFGSFNKGPFKGKRLCFGSSQNITHSSPSICAQILTPLLAQATPAGPPLLRCGMKRSTNAAFRRAAVCIANFKHSKCNKSIIASFRTHAVLARSRGDADYGEGLPARVVSHHSNSDGIPLR